MMLSSALPTPDGTLQFDAQRSRRGAELM